MSSAFEQLELNEHIIENYKEAVEMFNEVSKVKEDNKYTEQNMKTAISHGALIMFRVFLDEIEKGNLIVKENKK